MKITVVGSGYVGLSNGILLAQHNEVVLLDVIQEKVDQINRKESPIEDDYIQDYLANKSLNLKATLDKKMAYENAEFVVIATPTDYDPETNFFNTKSIESVIKDVLVMNPTAVIVIKSTVPVGYTNSIKAQFGLKVLFFPPNFCGKEKRSTITYILHALLLAKNLNVQKSLQIYCNKVPLNKISRCF